MININDVQFREAAKEKDDSALLRMMSNYGMHFNKTKNLTFSPNMNRKETRLNHIMLSCTFYIKLTKTCILYKDQIALNELIKWIPFICLVGKRKSSNQISLSSLEDNCVI